VTIRSYHVSLLCKTSYSQSSCTESTAELWCIVGEYYLVSEADAIQLRTWRPSNTVTNDHYTELSKKMDGIWNRYNLKSTGRIYTFGVLKFSEKFKVLDLP